MEQLDAAASAIMYRQYLQKAIEKALNNGNLSYQQDAKEYGHMQGGLGFSNNNNNNNTISRVSYSISF